MLFRSSTNSNENYGSGSVSKILEAIGYAIEQNVDVISMSFGGESKATILPLETALKKAEEKGILLVGSAGNYGLSSYIYPASFDCVISVASIDESGLRSSFSRYNDKLFVTAPGGNIKSTGYLSSNLYRTDGGTSFSAPIVSAMGAIAKQVNKSITNDGFKELLKASVVDKGAIGFDNYYGYGAVDFELFIDNLLGKEYNITYNLDGGQIEDIGYAEKYRISRIEDVLLPQNGITRRNAMLVKG